MSIMQSYKTALCTFIFMSVISYGMSRMSIKCFSCRSDNDPKCADPFDNSTIPISSCVDEKGLSNLSGIKAIMCSKIRQKVNGEWQIVRDCAYMDEERIQGDKKPCVTSTGPNNTVTETCYCDSKDACNTSSTFVPLPLLLIILVTLPSALFKIFV